MSAARDIETARSKIYDGDGRTVIPEDIRELNGWGKGTTLKFVFIDGEVKVVSVDE
jgi:bifunctional DNA-binding transcriptional regulator/antitoxin component of YhaV-PrlF toxin-antitoxin module